MRRWNTVLGWVAAVLVFVALVWLWQWRREHRFDTEIEAAATKYGVDKFLLKAVVWRESGFNPNAQSRKGALGLTQVMPATGKDWAKATGQIGFVETNLLQPTTNLDAGAWYLKRALGFWSGRDLPRTFDASSSEAIVPALAEYNAGRNKVTRWVSVARTSGRPVLDCIDLSETRHYVVTLLAKAEKYRRRGHL